MSDILANSKSPNSNFLSHSSIINDSEKVLIKSRIEELFVDTIPTSRINNNLPVEFKLYMLIRQHKALKSKAKNRDYNTAILDEQAFTSGANDRDKCTCLK